MATTVPSAAALDVIDLVPIAVSVVDADGRYLRTNAAHRMLLEELAGDAAPQGVRGLPPAVRRDGSPLPVAELPGEVTRRTGEELDGVEIGLREPGGGLRWLRVSTRRIAGPGPTWSVCVTSIDVTAALALRHEYEEQQARHETVVTSLHEGLVIHDLDRRIVSANPRALEVLGLTEDQIFGRSSTDPAWRAVRPDGTSMPGEDHPGARTLATGRAHLDREMGIHTPDDAVRWLRVNSTPLRDADGTLYGAASTFVDETEAVEARRAAARADGLFTTAFEEAPVGMALVSLDGSWLQVNRSLCDMVGYREADLLERTFQEITHPDDLDADLDLLRRLIAGDLPRYALEKRYVTSSGEIVWVALSVSVVRAPDGSPDHLVAHVKDITERRRLQETLQRLADHDPLTGLQNRRRFEEEMRRQVGRCRRYGERAALLLFDLDGFKRVNDTRGHKAGDEVLRAVSAAVSDRLRASDQLARLGGDEFAVLAPGINHGQARALADSLAAEVRRTAARVHPDGPVVTASVGIASMQGETADEEATLAAADAAMYREKPGSGPATLDPVGRPGAAPSAPPRTVRVLHGDDSAPHRRLLRQMLQRSPDLLLVGSVERGRVVAEAEELGPDVVLCASATRALAAELRTAAPTCRVLGLTSHHTGDDRLGGAIAGTLLWTQSATAVADAIRDVAAG